VMMFTVKVMSIW